MMMMMMMTMNYLYDLLPPTECDERLCFRRRRYVGRYICVWTTSWLAPIQVRSSPNIVSHTFGHRGRDDQILEGEEQRSRSVGEVCALLSPSSLLCHCRLPCIQVCNSLGQCHCEVGFRPPDCSQPGGGGSYHSNQASPYTPGSTVVFVTSITLIIVQVREWGLTYIHTCRSYVHTPRDIPWTAHL